jgi:hypothetical protein
MSTDGAVAAATGRPGMSTDRKAAAWIGVLYVIGTVALVLSAVVTDAVLTGPIVLAQVAAQQSQLAAGVLLVLLAGFSLALVPVVFWPIGRRYSETLAMGYVVFRGAIETVIYFVGALGWLVLVALSAEPDAGPLAGLVRTTAAEMWDLGTIPFALGALMFCLLLYRSRLVPRWLSAWGLIGAALYVVPTLGSMSGLSSLGVLMAPLAVQEMVMAAWLIGKGFSPAAVAAASADAMPRWPVATPRTVPAR